MADAVSRSGAGLGALLIVPAAGVTHAASDIGGYCVSLPYVVCAILSTSVAGASEVTAGRRPAKMRENKNSQAA